MDFKLAWNRYSNRSNFSDFPSKVGIIVVRDLGSFEILVIMLLKLAELLFVTNCLLKGQQNLVCFNCRRGVLTAKLRLTRGARLLLFSS